MCRQFVSAFLQSVHRLFCGKIHITATGIKMQGLYPLETVSITIIDIQFLCGIVHIIYRPSGKISLFKATIN